MNDDRMKSELKESIETHKLVEGHLFDAATSLAHAKQWCNLSTGIQFHGFGGNDPAKQIIGAVFCDHVSVMDARNRIEKEVCRMEEEQS